METEPHPTPSQKMAAYRARLRKQGLRPVQVWIPDIRAPEFVQEARRQSLLLKDDPQEQEITGWLDSVADTDDWQA